MCGRYNLSAPTSQVIEQFELFQEKDRIEKEYQPLGEIFPTRTAPILQMLSSESFTWNVLPWGVSVSWLKKPIINARTDALETSEMWKKVLKTGRCLVPANSFFEWTGETAKKRERFTIGPSSEAKDGLWTFAGLVLENQFVIITTEANPKMLQIHHRQPALVLPEQRKSWVSLENQKPLNCIHQFQDNEMQISGNFLF